MHDLDHSRHCRIAAVCRTRFDRQLLDCLYEYGTVDPSAAGVFSLLLATLCLKNGPVNFTSVENLHPLTIATVTQEMMSRLLLKNQYIDTVVEEADEGRADRIALRIYGDLKYLWVVTKFAGLNSLDGRIQTGTTLRLPSRGNILRALQRERTDQIPVFEYIRDADLYARLNDSSQEVALASKTVYETVAGENILMGQPIIMDEHGRAMLAVNDGENYKVIGLAMMDALPNGNIKYLAEGEVSLSNWGVLRDDESVDTPPPTTVLWLAPEGRGKLSIHAPSISGKHAVKLGSMRSGSLVFVDIGQPLGM